MKKAFVVASNHQDLRGAERIAKKISESLRIHGYCVNDDYIGFGTQPQPMARAFEDFAATTVKGDHFLFYYVGHGISQRGDLMLVHDAAAPTSFRKIAAYLHLNDCKAQHKCVFLDCCHAYKAEESLDFRLETSYSVLMAAQLAAKEPDELDDGLPAPFMSYHFYRALSGDVSVTYDNRITPEVLHQFLNRERRDYNKEHPSDPIPEIKHLSATAAQSFELVSLGAMVPGFTRIDRAFLDREARRHLVLPALYHPKAFYGAQPQVQWWGVCGDLVAVRQNYEKALETARRIGHWQPVVCWIRGSGGMGKTTHLRLLVRDLIAGSGCVVWWLSDWEQFRDTDTQIFEQASQTIWLVLDNWDALKLYRAELIPWIAQLQARATIKLLVSSRGEDTELEKYGYGGGIWDLDTADNLSDNHRLLDKTIETVGVSDQDWARVVQQARTGGLQTAKPFQLLYVLQRWTAQDPIEDFTAAFYEVVRADLKRLRTNEFTKGLAFALEDYANMVMNTHRLTFLTKGAFLRLADRYHRHDWHELTPNFLDKPLSDKGVWDMVPYYLMESKKSVDPNNEISEKLLRFTKEYFYEAITFITKQDFAKREKQAVTHLIQDKSAFSSSTILRSYGKHTHLFRDEELRKWVDFLLESHNTHHAYATLIFNEKLKMTRFEVIADWVKKYFVIEPNNTGFSSNLIQFLEKTPNQVDSNNLIVYLSENFDTEQNYVLISKYLQILDKPNRIKIAMEWLEKDGVAHQIISHCFKILGKTELTRQKATEFLDKENVDYQIISTCFKILGKTELTRQKATEFLQKEDVRFGVISNCFQILGKTELTRQKATEFLQKENVDYQIISHCFQILGKTELTRQKATEFLQKEDIDKEIICHCFQILGKTELTRQKATEFLQKENVASDIICHCFQILGKTELTRQKATDFLDKESIASEIINRCLWILDSEAYDYALKILDQWEANDKFTVLRCIKITQNEVRTQKIFDIVYTKTLSQFIDGRFQTYAKPLFAIPRWKRETESVLSKWRTQNRRLVYACLIGYESKIDFIRETCKAILSRWEEEIQQPKNKEYFDFHIQKSLSHPQLKELSKQVSQAIVQKAATDPHFIGGNLLLLAQNIVSKGIYPDWSTED